MFHVEQASALRILLLEGSTELGIPLDTEQTQLFMVYLKQLKLWNRSFNLTAITQDEDIIIKHFIDSLAALKAVSIDIESRLLDIGTGAGFPGIPLKIARPDLRITLIEPVHKKSSFLHFIIGLLQLHQVNVFQGTINMFMQDDHTPYFYDYVTTRALDPALVFQHGKKLLVEGGKAIIYSSGSTDKSSPSRNWNLLNDYRFELPNAYGTRTISIFSPSS